MTVRKAVVTLFGLGYLPVAPGTWGSAGAAVVTLLVYLVFGGGSAFHLSMIVLTIAASVAGVACGPWAVSFYNTKDPKPFVIDEAAGQWLALVWMPIGQAGWVGVLGIVGVQFFLFRIADIVKPPPARQLERLPHGWGIVADDLAAAVYANLVGQIICRFVLGMYT